MKYAYNLIEVKGKQDFGFCPQSLKALRKNLKEYFPDETEFSAVKFARDAENKAFVRTTIATRCLKLHITEVDRADLPHQDNRVVVLSGELERRCPFTDVEALRLDDDGFQDFEDYPTYVSIAYDLTHRVGVLFRANVLDGDENAGISIVFGEDLCDGPDTERVKHLENLGVPKAVLKSKGLIENLPYLT